MMLTDTEIKVTGVDALVAVLGEAQTEKFIARVPQRQAHDDL
jgi:hypothetical protein